MIARVWSLNRNFYLGAQRYALFFEPGTYGTSSNPLNFQVGFYTQVAGLGAQPGQVVINGAIIGTNLALGANGTHNFRYNGSGTLSLSKGLGYLSGSAKTQMRQAIAKAGFKTATFTVWVDGQHLIRKYDVTQAGTALTETIDLTLDSINKPVNITAPTADQTMTLPTGDLSGLSG